MRAKLGLDRGRRRDDALIDDLLTLLHAQRVDYTSLLPGAVGVGARRRGTGPSAASPTPARSTPGRTAGARSWRTSVRPDEIAAAMDRVNPVYIPRNHLVEEALAAATAGDLEPFRRLLDVLAQPFDERPGLEAYAAPAPAELRPVPHVLRHVATGGLLVERRRRLLRREADGFPCCATARRDPTAAFRGQCSSKARLERTAGRRPEQARPAVQTRRALAHGVRLSPSQPCSSSRGRPCGSGSRLVRTVHCRQRGIPKSSGLISPGAKASPTRPTGTGSSQARAM